MKTRYFIFISYRGTSYHGWQLQPDSITVQKILENALSVILGEKISSTGAGRTDAGVHALFFCAHFDSLSPDLDRQARLVHRLNSFLPEDISVNAIRRVVPDAHARFSALSRTYKYFISTAKDPFATHSSWFLYGDIDIVKMNMACSLLKGYSDFTSFSRLHSGAKTNICTIFDALWIREGNMLVFTITADRFLRNMVRAVVGTMVETGFGKLSPDDFGKIIEARDRGRAGVSAPAKGLFLTGIGYPPEVFTD